MRKQTKQLAIAVTTLSGTIIGVGMFGTPYAISRLGWPLALGFFLVLGAVQLLQHLFLAEAAIACDERVRFSGLVERYLSPRYKQLASVVWAFGIWAALVAYVLIGGQFLHTLFSPLLGGDLFTYQLGWAIAGSLAISRGLDFIGQLEFFGTVGLVAALFVIFGISLPHVEVVHFSTAVIDPLMAYGVILFSLSGVSVITELEDEVSADSRLFRLSVVIGLLLTTALTFLFGFIVYGVTGEGTTTDAVTGLQTALGGIVPLVAAAFGFLAVATSFVGLGTNLRAVFQYDYKMRPMTAWLVTVSVPFGLLLFGSRSFLSVISFSAAVFGGITATLISLMYARITNRKLLGANGLGVPVWVAYLTVVLLLAGALIQVGSTFMGWLK